VTAFSRHIIPGALACALSVAATAAFSEEEGHAPAHEWSYAGAHGPKHWGEIKADYASCKSGKTQSPIDIRGAVRADLPPIQFDYHAAPLDIIDNGHTVQINYAPGSSISVGGQRYELAQFHFHEPSEERIDGKGYAMVAHFVHKNPEGKLAVVAVLMKKGGAPNPFVKTLWSHLPKEKEKEETVAGVSVDPTTFLPKDHAYYTFSGSLTTPPCSEGVTWFVLKTPVGISDAQAARFGKLYSHNARPVQARNDRAIQVSK